VIIKQRLSGICDNLVNIVSIKAFLLKRARSQKNICLLSPTISKKSPITGKIHDRTDCRSDKFSSKIPCKVSCSFQTNYHTDSTTFGVDQTDVVSDSVEGASAPTTSFTFDLVMTTDHQLDEEVPEGFSRVIGDMNFFKVKHNLLSKHSNNTF